MPNINWQQPPGRDEFGRQEHLGTPGQSPDFQTRRSLNPINKLPLNKAESVQPLEPQSSPVEVRKIGERFTLFGENKIRRDGFPPVRPKRDIFDSQVVLNLTDLSLEDGTQLPQLPFYIYAHMPSITAKTAHVITPFNKALGYQINKDDFRASTRQRKWNLTQETSPYLEEADPHALLLSAEVLSKDLVIAHLKLGDNPHLDLLKPDAKKIFEALRLQLFFPQSDGFQGYPDEGALEAGYIAIYNFFPFDTGPLPVPEYHEAGDYPMENGLSIAVPDDLAQLRQIQGKFVFDTTL